MHDDVYGAFRERLLSRIARAAVGDPSDPETEVGPLVNEAQMDAVLGAIERGRAEGGTLLTGGGERLEGDGYLVPPTLFEDVDDRGYLSCEEVFGPVASLYRFGDLDEGIRRANGTSFGLSASIFTSDARSVQRFVDGIDAGIVRVNAATAGGEPHVPFGGSKESGYGPREQGRAALRVLHRDRHRLPQSLSAPIQADHAGLAPRPAREGDELGRRRDPYRARGRRPR